MVVDLESKTDDVCMFVFVIIWGNETKTILKTVSRFDFNCFSHPRVSEIASLSQHLLLATSQIIFGQQRSKA